MAQKYSFDEKTINSEKYVVAKARGRDSEPIRVRADWVESDDLEGKWEELIKQVVQPETITEIDIADGHGGIPRREAVETLAGATADGETIVSSEEQADVLVEYLAAEGIIDVQGGELILFRDPDGASLGGPQLMNWAALMAAVIESIDEHLERVEDAQNRFEQTVDSLENDRPTSNDRLSETAQRLKNLGPGQGVPNPEQLDEEERQKYHQLKDHYLYLRNLEQAKEQNLFENVAVGLDQMGMAIDKLEAAKDVYEMFHTNTRKAALKNSVFPEEALEFVQNAGNLVNELAGVEQHEPEDVEYDDLEAMIEEDLDETVQERADEISNLAETAERAAGEKNLQI